MRRVLEHQGDQLQDDASIVVLEWLTGDAEPDWETLGVTEPVEVIGQHGRVWYEWTATVGATG